MGYAVTDAELADAFERLARVQGHLRIPRWKSAGVVTRLRAGPSALNRGTRFYTVRTLHRLTDQVVRQTRRTSIWLGHTRDEADAAGLFVRAHVLGTRTPRETRTRARLVGGWVADLVDTTPHGADQ